MITFGVPPPLPRAAVTFLQLTIFICLLLLLLITIVPTDPPAAAAVATTDEDAAAPADDDEATAVAATEDDDDDDADVLPDGNKEGATLPADHEVCLTTITPGRHCWWCWRICDAVCWADGVADGEGLQLPAVSATVGVIDTDTIAGLPLRLLEVLLEGMLEDDDEEEEVDEEVAEDADAQVPAGGGVRNLRYGSS